MAPRTRSTTSSPVKKASATAEKNCEPKRDHTKVILIPKQVTADAKILSLRHPRTGNENKFLFCPQSGLYELTKSSAASTDPCSMLFSPAACDGASDISSVKKTNQFGDGWITKDAKIFTATRFDVCFILLRILAPQITNTKKTLFQSLDDLLDASDVEDESLNYIVKHGRQLIEDGMSSICDIIDAGDEKMYRYSEEKTQQLINTKAERVSQSGLPASLEDRFVTRALAPPFSSVRRADTLESLESTESAKSEATGSQLESLDSQSSTASTTVSAVFSELSATSTIATSSEDVIPAEVTNLQRLRVAQNFIYTSYLSPSLAAHLKSSESGASMPTSFKPLDDYLKHLATLRAEAAASRSTADFNRKRGLEEEEAAQDRAEKKRKQEEDEKRRKANESRGVRDLKKVNVSGMKKMSDFFMKKPTIAKAKT